MSTNRIISGMFSQMADALATKGYHHIHISNKEVGDASQATAEGYHHNHIVNKKEGDAAKGYRFAASPDVYQSGGRHHHIHISNKEVGDASQGENPFKIAAYRKAAKVLADYPIDVAEAYQKGGIKALTAIPGIGAALSKKIAEFIDTGRMHKYDEVMSQKPRRE